MPTAEGKYHLMVEHQSAHGPTVIQVRGSLIASSLQSLRTLDLFDRYIEHLPKEHHDQVLYVLAASWVPIEVALAHYGACDAMQLTEAEVQEIGGHVSKRIMGTFLGTLIRTTVSVVGSGTVLSQYPRLWDRLLMGGSCSVMMLTPRDARIESRGVPMFRYRYFRAAYTGLLRGASSVFRSSVHARARNATSDSLTIDLNWA